MWEKVHPSRYLEIKHWNHWKSFCWLRRNGGTSPCDSAYGAAFLSSITGLAPIKRILKSSGATSRWTSSFLTWQTFEWRSVPEKLWPTALFLFCGVSPGRRRRRMDAPQIHFSLLVGGGVPAFQNAGKSTQSLIHISSFLWCFWKETGSCHLWDLLPTTINGALDSAFLGFPSSDLSRGLPNTSCIFYSLRHRRALEEDVLRTASLFFIAVTINPVHRIMWCPLSAAHSGTAACCSPQIKWITSFISKYFRSQLFLNNTDGYFSKLGHSWFIL